ncbi:class E sortase [Streptomyces sp. NPDC051561]|uniref:class E sortase n=1 Tax=Streptomyces sp. NPDC051561 TaxID=3365658 RepID=UPI0037AF2857
MTPLRPGNDGAGYGPPQGEGYEGYVGEGLGAAVDRLADPLNDPLPGHQAPSWAREPQGAYDPYAAQQAPVQQPVQQPLSQQQYQEQQQYREPHEWYDPEGYRRDWYGQQQAYVPQQQPDPEAQAQPHQAYAQPQQQMYAQPQQLQPQPHLSPPHQPQPRQPQPHQPSGRESYGYEQPLDDPTFALPAVEPDAPSPPRPRIAEPEAPEGGGRAERRRAAQGKPARGRAQTTKEGTGVVVSRFVGELFITFGVLMLLFVTYQLWWTNVRAGIQANGATHSLQDDWSKGGGTKPRAAGVFEPGQGFAIMHIPKLDVKVPVAEGIDKHKVLDRGMVGHYADGKLKTAMPADKQGNFAVAGHRNTHGEPFRYVNQLVKGDKIVVETQDAFYTYEMTSMLPQTSPSNVSVIRPVPQGSGFTKPGRYLTLTTCTPEFTSTYRLIVWGKMVDERPRSKGMPPALS